MLSYDSNKECFIKGNLRCQFAISSLSEAEYLTVVDFHSKIQSYLPSMFQYIKLAQEVNIWKS